MKLAKDVRERNYELTYLVPGSLTETELSKVKDEVSALIAKHKGKVVDAKDWGKKPLAYTITHHQKRHTEASYVHAVITFPAENVVAFEKELFLVGGVIRHLLVVAETHEATKPVPRVPKHEKEEVAE